MTLSFVFQGSVPPYAFKIVLMFSLTNGVISPYVYMYRSKRIQREVLRLFGFSTKAKRADFERRRPNYHQLSVNLERIPASPICLEGNFKLSDYRSSHEEGTQAKSTSGQVPLDKSFLFKVFHLDRWKCSLLLSSTCITSSSLSSASSASTNSCYPASYVSSNISSSTQTLSNFLPVNTPLV